MGLRCDQSASETIYCVNFGLCFSSLGAVGYSVAWAAHGAFSTVNRVVCGAGIGALAALVVSAPSAGADAAGLGTAGGYFANQQRVGVGDVMYQWCHSLLPDQQSLGLGRHP